MAKKNKPKQKSKKWILKLIIITLSIVGVAFAGIIIVQVLSGLVGGLTLFSGKIGELIQTVKSWFNK